MKTNSINQINTNNVLTPKQILLKNEISVEISINGTSKNLTPSFKNFGEKYRIGLLNSFYIEGIKDASVFLTQYLKILNSPYFPILRVESVILLYKNWKSNDQFIDNLVHLVNEKSFIVNFDEFWNRVFRIWFKFHKRRSIQFEIFFDLISRFDWNENTLIMLTTLANNVFDLSTLKTRFWASKEIKEYQSQICEKIYFHIDIWFNWIIKKSNKIKEEDKIFLMNKIVEYISFNHSILEADKNKKSFHTFLNIIYSRFSTVIFLSTPLEQIDFAFRCFSANPTFFEKQKFYISDYSDFVVRDKNALILMRFLKDYHFPTILIENYDKLSSENLEWLDFVLKGNSIRMCKNLPFKLSSKAAHIFNHLYTGYLYQAELDRMKFLKLSMTDYLIYSQLRSNGLTHEVTLEILLKNISSNKTNIEFWIYTYTLLYSQGMKSSFVSSIHDHINYKVFQMNEKLNLKGKSISNLIKDINKWHNELTEKNYLNKYQKVKFKKTAKSKFEIREQKIYIKQILNGFELFLEGKDLHHCVFSYLIACKRNYCSIFSLRTIDENENERRLVTIEVNQKTIYQIRGNYNRHYNNEELEIIKLWAESENLKIAA